MSIAVYLSLWLSLAVVVVAYLWWLAASAPILEDDWEENVGERLPPLARCDLMLSNGHVIKNTMAGLWYWSDLSLSGMPYVVAYRQLPDSFEEKV